MPYLSQCGVLRNLSSGTSSGSSGSSGAKVGGAGSVGAGSGGTSPSGPSSLFIEPNPRLRGVHSAEQDQIKSTLKIFDGFDDGVDNPIQPEILPENLMKPNVDLNLWDPEISDAHFSHSSSRQPTELSEFESKTSTTRIWRRYDHYPSNTKYDLWYPWLVAIFEFHSELDYILKYWLSCSG